MWEKIKKEGISVFSKVRKIAEEIKENLYSAKSERLIKAWNDINLLCISAIFTFVYFIGAIVLLLNLKVVSIVVLMIDIVHLILSTNNDKVYRLTKKVSFRILQLLLRYGKVVTKKDWKNIKKHCKKKVYKKLLTKESCGYCYYYSRVIAFFLEDAQLMYCSIKDGDKLTAHSVIVKNNCVYDTNYRKHYNYEEYIKKEGATIYKMFSEDEYRKESFFDDVREDFKKWCAEKNVYCDPQ